MKIKRFGVAAIALAAAGALTLSGCTSGGASPSAGAGDSTAVITTNGSEPQNPLVPTNTNETGGGKILDVDLRGPGLLRRRGRSAQRRRGVDRDRRRAELHDQDQGRPEVHERRARHRELVRRRLELRRTRSRTSSSRATSSSRSRASATTRTRELTGLEVVDDTTFTVKLKQPESDFPLRLGYSAFFPLPESAFEDIEAFGENPVGNGPYMLDGEGAWKHNEKIDLVVNPDYDGARKAAERWARHHLLRHAGSGLRRPPGRQPRRARRRSPTARSSTFEDEFGDRAVNQAAAIFQSFTIPDRLAALRWRRGQAPSRRHLEGDQPRGDHRRDLRRAPAPRRTTSRRRSSTATPRTSPAPRCSTSTPTRRRSCGPRPTPSRRGTAPSRSPTTPTVATRPGSTLSRTSIEEQPRHRRVGRSVPDLRRGPHRDHRPHHPDRRSAPVGRPTTRRCSTSSARSTRRVPARTTATTRAPSSTRSSRRASPRPTSTPRTRSSSRRRRSSSRTSPRSRCGTRTVNGAWSESVDNVRVRLELGAAVLRDHQERVILVQGRLGVRL